ncbi:hypothetical protein BsWGS_17361 [Bradybaena similaris]
MQVTGHLREPLLLPCPGRNDLTQLRDPQCQPVKCTRQPDWTGMDCCQYFKDPPNTWARDLVHVDRVNPEKFNYDQYRYQVFAKPSSASELNSAPAQAIPDKQYVPPTTDIRALRQTTYIPVVPHKPGGVTEYTFPMTPQTMNDPDVTTACCVPVIPCNPGFQNLTPHVKSDPSLMCQNYNRCDQPVQIGPRRVNIDAEVGRTQAPPGHMGHLGGVPVSAPEFMVPPSNQQGGGCLGLPGTFAEPRQRYDIPYPPQINPPHFSEMPPPGGQGCVVHDAYTLGLDVMEDGVNPRHGQGTAFTSIKNLRYKDRVGRAVQACSELPDERVRRLKSMYGAFGAYLIANPYTRRHLEGIKDTIALQGNGFRWSYPRYENQQCYIVERNPRC